MSKSGTARPRKTEEVSTGAFAERSEVQEEETPLLQHEGNRLVLEVRGEKSRSAADASRPVRDKPAVQRFRTGSKTAKCWIPPKADGVL